MAGHTTLGIRRSDGSEYWFCIHARGLDYLIHDPDFQREGEAVTQLIEKATQNGEGGWDVSILKRAKYFGYGYAVVDFILGKVLSRQGYCALGEVLASGPEGLEFTGRLKDAGDLKEIRLEGASPVMPDYGHLMDQVVGYNTAAGFIEKYPYSYLRVVTQGPLEVDHDCMVSDQMGARDVRAWAKAHGWKLKTIPFASTG